MSNYKLSKCHDCGVTEGQIHELGCDNESCPFCGGQLLGCDCFDAELKAKYGEMDDNEYDEKWVEYLDLKGRTPYIEYPVICAKCGQINPEFFSVPDEEWKKNIEQRMQNTVICLECFEHIKTLVKNAAK